MNQFHLNALVFTRLAVKLGIFLTLVGIIMPPPTMPSIDIDASWMFGMNQAVAQGLSFGKDIIFTYGPYSALLTTVYHPATALLITISSIYLAILYSLSINILMQQIKWQWTLIFFVALIALLHPQIIFCRDALLFIYPLIVGLSCFKILQCQIDSRLALVIIILLFSGFGLLPLVKSSLLILCAAITVFSFIYFFDEQKKLYAAVCITSPIIASVLFWLISGQPLKGLFDYIFGSFDIISGYTEAMALPSNSDEIVNYLLAVICLLFTIYRQTTLSTNSKYFLVFNYAIFLFIAFKAGFIRHDIHAITAGISILIAALSLPFILQFSKTIIFTIVLGLLSWFYIDNHHIHTSMTRVLNNFHSTYSFIWQFRDDDKLTQQFNSTLETIKNKVKIPILSGTSDIYSFNQTILVASGNHWSPRPILQSYSAYTPQLADINKQHLLNSNSPDNIFFSVEPIDYRVPAMEDGASWTTLLTHYHPAALLNNYFLLLQKNAKVINENESFKDQGQLYHLGETIAVPQMTQPVFVQIDIKPTALGRLASLFFKIEPLYMVFNLKNGSEKSYRLVSGMAKSGFMISPLIENTTEFIMLYGDQTQLLNKTVASFSVKMPHNHYLWQAQYSYENPIKVYKVS